MSFGEGVSGISKNVAAHPTRAGRIDNYKIGEPPFVDGITG
jgi:hypothetical protein